MSARSIVLTEVGLRDGLQCEAASISTKDKVAIARALSQAGYRRIEVGTLGTPAWLSPVPDTAEVLAHLRGRVEAELQVLAGDLQGVQQARQAGADTVSMVVATTEPLSECLAHSTVDGTIATVARAVRSGGVGIAAVVAAAFACPYTGPVGARVTLRVVNRLVEVGVQRITLADTVGTAGPGAVGDLVREVQMQHPDLELGFHARDTRGMGLANALAAVDAGARGLVTSLGGLGEGPFTGQGVAGNVPSEDIIGLLDDLGMSPGIDLDGVAACSAYLEELLSHPLPSRRLALFRATGSAQ